MQLDTLPHRGSKQFEKYFSPSGTLTHMLPHYREPVVPPDLTWASFCADHILISYKLYQIACVVSMVTLTGATCSLSGVITHWEASNN